MVKIPRRIIAKISPSEQQLSLRHKIGEAIDEYSQVEYLLILLLEAILERPPRICAILFKAMQNVRARGNMFGDLIAMKTDGSLSTHWRKIQRFLLKLAEFRNAMAHWTFSTMIYKKTDGGIFCVPGLHSVGDDDMKPITESEILAFLKDCDHAKAILLEFNFLVKNAPLTSQEISQIQPVRPNLAILRSDPTPRAHQPPRPPSIPSPLQKGRRPSAKQRRQRALSGAKKTTG